MNSRGKSLVITLMGIIVLIYMIFFKYFRNFDAFGIGFVMICCSIIIIIGKRIKLLKYLLPFYIISIIILSFSLVDMMPDSWTQYRSPSAALRQWAWLPVLSITSSALYIFLCEHWRWIVRNSLWLAISLFIITRLIRILTGQIDNFDMEFFIYGIDNENSPIIALVLIYMHCNVKSRLKAIIVGTFLIFLSTSQTTLVVGIISLLALWPRLHKPMLIGIVISGFLFIGFAQTFFRELIYIDPNSAFRGLVWRDATQILKDTLGLGVGYGTEYIKNDFRSIDSDFNRYVEEGASDRLFIGTHSSLYDVAIRTGFLGAALLLIGFFRELRGSVLDQQLANLRTAIVGALIFNNFFNMGLASLNVTMGTGLFFAVCILCVNRAPPVSIEHRRPNATPL